MKVDTDNGRVIFTRIAGDGDEDYARWISSGHGEKERPTFSIQRFTFETDRRTGRTTEVAPYYRAYINSMTLAYGDKYKWTRFEDACNACDKRAYRDV